MPKPILYPCVALPCYPFHSHTERKYRNLTPTQPKWHVVWEKYTCQFWPAGNVPGCRAKQTGGKKIVMWWNFKRKKGETRTVWQTNTTRNVDEERNIFVNRGREANLAIWASTVRCLNVHFSSWVCMWSTQTRKPQPNMVVCQSFSSFCTALMAVCWKGGVHSLTHLFPPSLSTVYIWNTASVSF